MKKLSERKNKCSKCGVINMSDLEYYKGDSQISERVIVKCLACGYIEAYHPFDYNEKGEHDNNAEKNSV